MAFKQMYLPMSLYTFIQVEWIQSKGTKIISNRNGRKLTNLSRSYDDLLMKLLVATLTDDSPRLHNMPIVPLMVNEHMLYALIDTDAEGTCINVQTAWRLNLKSSGTRTPIKTISDKDDTIFFDFTAKFNWLSQNGSSIRDRFQQTFNGVPFPKSRNKYDVIIGRDILKKVAIIYDGKSREIKIKWG